MSDIKPEVDSVEYSQRETIQQQNDRNHEVVAVQGNQDEPGSVYQLGWKTILALLSLSMANSCAALANTANTVIKFQVASVAKGPADAVLASWIANGSFLVVLALGPIFGSSSDRVGKKWFMVCGAILGLMGGIIAGKAENIHQIIGGNILSGAANAGCIVSISAIQEIMPNRLRPWAVGFSQAMASAFVFLGTFLAATFVKTNTGNAGGWRWAYFFNGIIYGITAVAVGLAYFPPRPRLGRHKMLNPFTSEIDYIGILLMRYMISFQLMPFVLPSSFLIGTAATVSISCRALGGIIGITIFTAIYDNKYAELLGPEVAANGNAPILVGESVKAWKYVWIAVASLVATNGIAACFLKSVAPMMNHHVESALEPSKLREAQLS